MRVGIFDSGVGGITVLETAKKLLPNVDYIYYSDNNHVPYGTKTKEEVLGYVKEIVELLVREEVDAIVIACNTATSIAVTELRKLYSIPIIGMEPAVKLALSNHEKGDVLVTATPLTLKEAKFKSLVSSLGEKNRVKTLALPELVTYAEELNFDKDVIYKYLDNKLGGIDINNLSAIVLGCTHFVYFKKIFEDYLPEHIKIYDGNEGTIKHLKEVLGDNPGMHIKKIPQTDFYYSGKKCKDDTILNKYLKALE